MQITSKLNQRQEDNQQIKNALQVQPRAIKQFELTGNSSEHEIVSLLGLVYVMRIL